MRIITIAVFCVIVDNQAHVIKMCLAVFQQIKNCRADRFKTRHIAIVLNTRQRRVCVNLINRHCYSKHTVYLSVAVCSVHNIVVDYIRDTLKCSAARDIITVCSLILLFFRKKRDTECKQILQVIPCNRYRIVLFFNVSNVQKRTDYDTFCRIAVYIRLLYFLANYQHTIRLYAVGFIGVCRYRHLETSNVIRSASVLKVCDI